MAYLHSGMTMELNDPNRISYWVKKLGTKLIGKEMVMSNLKHYTKIINQ